jgi:hypothetical protein
MLGPVTLALALVLGQEAPTSRNRPVESAGCQGPEFSQLDFWVGEWDVVSWVEDARSGRPPARNTITRAHAGCVVVEQFAAPAFSGQSVTIFDRSTGQWHQTWVDSSGSLNLYEGRFESGTLVLHGSTPSRSAPQLRQRVRLTLSDLGNGRVRQRSERLNADGTWSTNYDLLYRRVPSK